MIADESILPKTSEDKTPCECTDFPNLTKSELARLIREEKWTSLAWEEVVAAFPSLRETSRRYEGNYKELINFQCARCNRAWLLEIWSVGPEIYVW